MGRLIFDHPALRGLACFLALESCPDCRSDLDQPILVLGPQRLAAFEALESLARTTGRMVITLDLDNYRKIVEEDDSNHVGHVYTSSGKEVSRNTFGFHVSKKQVRRLILHGERYCLRPNGQGELRTEFLQPRFARDNPARYFLANSLLFQLAQELAQGSQPGTQSDASIA